MRILSEKTENRLVVGACGKTQIDARDDTSSGSFVKRRTKRINWVATHRKIARFIEEEVSELGVRRGMRMPRC